MIETFVILCALNVDNGFIRSNVNVEYIITDSIASCEQLGKVNGVTTYQLEHNILVLSNDRDAKTLVYTCGPDLSGCKQSFSVDNRHINAWEE